MIVEEAWWQDAWLPLSSSSAECLWFLLEEGGLFVQWPTYSDRTLNAEHPCPSETETPLLEGLRTRLLLKAFISYHCTGRIGAIPSPLPSKRTERRENNPPWEFMNMKQELHSPCVFYLADGSAKWYSLDSGSTRPGFKFCLCHWQHGWFWARDYSCRMRG